VKTPRKKKLANSQSFFPEISVKFPISSNAIVANRIPMQSI